MAALLLVVAVKLYAPQEGQLLSDILAESHPEAKAWVEEMRQRYGRDSVEATARYYQSRSPENAGSLLARDIARGTAGRYLEIGRSMVTISPGELDDSHYDELAMMDVCTGRLLGDESVEMASTLLLDRVHALEAAKAEGGATWEAVRKNPFSAVIYSACKSREEYQDIWQTYCQYDWMPRAALLMSLVDVADPPEAEGQEGAPRASLDVVLEFIRLCGRYGSMRHFVRDVLEAESLQSWDDAGRDEAASRLLLNLAVAYEAYSQEGALVERICSRQIAPAEVIDLLMQNHALLANDRLAAPENPGAADDKFCEDVVQLCTSGKKELIALAQQLPGFMGLYRLEPALVEGIRSDCWNAGGVAMLYTACMDENNSLHKGALRHGLMAMRKYEELALWVFQEDNLGGHPQFYKVLAADWRVVPFLAKHADEGVEVLINDPARLDEELTSEGTPRKVSTWWEYLPGGALVKVADRILTGRPAHFEDYAWAAWDAFTLVPGVGATGLLAKAGMRTGVKSAGKALTKNTLRSNMRSASRNVPRRTIEEAARASGKGASCAARMGRLGKAALEKGMQLMRLTYRGAKATAQLGRKGIGWLMAHPTACRVLAAGMLAIELRYRTWPHRREIAQGIALMMQDLVEGAEAFIVNTVKKAWQELSAPLREIPNLLPQLGPSGWLCLLLSLVLVSWGALRRLGRALLPLRAH